MATAKRPTAPQGYIVACGLTSGTDFGDVELGKFCTTQEEAQKTIQQYLEDHVDDYDDSSYGVGPDDDIWVGVVRANGDIECAGLNFTMRGWTVEIS